MTSIDGLITGLNTSQIISQLMQLERAPQARLQQRQTEAQKVETELREMRSDVQAIRNMAADLRLGSGWDQLKATSSDESVTVSAGSGNVSGEISFVVQQTAAAHTIYSNETVASLDTVVTSGGETLAEVVDSINNTDGLGYRAMAVNTGSGYRLQVMATETGAASSVGLDTSQFTAFTGFTTLATGRDAQIEIQGDNPYTITSDSNTFNDVLPGLNVTVTQATVAPVTVTVAEDNEAQADSIAEIVEAVNSFLERSDTATAANPGAEPGILFGNSSVRRTRDAILRAVTDGVASSSFEAASLAGITVTEDGRLEFNRADFINASETDRVELERLFVAPTGDTDLGVLDRIVAAAEEATATGSGRLWSEAEATKSRIERWGDQIDAYEKRFEIREATLRRQYAALEVALGALSEQSNYLAGQLAGLPTINSGG